MMKTYFVILLAPDPFNLSSCAESLYLSLVYKYAHASGLDLLSLFASHW